MASDSNPFFAPKTRPLILGHRGVPLLEQENTAAALRKAVELGLDGVEFDVMATRDGRVVLFHDDDTERLTGQRGRIADLTWDAVSKLRIQRRLPMGKNAQGEDVEVTYPREQPIPLLEEVLAEFGGKLAMNIELKPGSPDWRQRRTGTLAAEVIGRAGLEETVVVTSFDFFRLRALEQARPGIHSGFAYDDNFLDFASKWLLRLPELRGELGSAAGNQNGEILLNRMVESNRIGRWIDSTVIDVEHTLIARDTVAKLRARGMAVGAYTIFPLDTALVKKPLPFEEEVRIARSLIEQGADWIETDDPVKLMEMAGGNT